VVPFLLPLFYLNFSSSPGSGFHFTSAVSVVVPFSLGDVGLGTGLVLFSVFFLENGGRVDSNFSFFETRRTRLIMTFPSFLVARAVADDTLPPLL